MTRILLTTDLPQLAEAVAAALYEPSYEIEVAADPHRVSALWLEKHHDLVITDSQVGTMGGMAVVRDVRAAAAQEDRRPPATILLLDRSADVFMARRSGSDAWIAKPFGAFELRDLVDRLAAAHHSATA